MQAVKYSNPRVHAIFRDWPLGGNKRGMVTFSIESRAGKGERGVRVTIDPRTGRESAPKTLTYATKARIVEGDDGRTYIAQLTMYGFITIMKSDMKHQHGEGIFERDPDYAEVRALFDS